jgi:hypothetical protein
MSSEPFPLKFRSKISVFLFRAPTLIFFCIGILGFIFLLKPSAEPQIFIFSYFRALALGLIASLVLYSILSLRHTALSSINNHIFYTILFGLLFVELVLRSIPSLIPNEIVYLLPADDRKVIAIRRGLFTEQALAGDGMLFHWKPKTSVASKPWVKIDTDGYRNRNVPKNSTDVVILGASVPLAADVPFDLTDHFIKDGYSAYSLAMGSYAPQHYRDAYRQYVLGRNLKHKAVIILVIPNYDLEKATYYERIAASSGSYKDYLKPAPIVNYGIPAIDKLWTLSILNSLPTTFAHKLKSSFNSRTATITTNWASFSLPENSFSPKERPLGWVPFGAAITQIINDSRKQGAVPIITLYPGVAARLAPYAELPTSISSKFEGYVKSESKRLAKIVASAGGHFIDLTEKFRLHSKEKLLTLTPLNLHLNQAGLDLLYEAIRPSLEKPLSQ